MLRYAPHRIRAGLAVWAGVLACGTVAAQSTEWFMHAGGISHHFQPTQAPGHAWQDQHAGLGLERRSEAFGDSRGDWRLSAAGGVLQDSRAFWGGYGGMAWLHEWRRSGLADLGLGVGAYGFYRSVSWSGRMALVPALLPMASLQFPAAAMGLDLVYVPRVPARHETMPAVLHLQLDFRLD